MVDLGLFNNFKRLNIIIKKLLIFAMQTSTRDGPRNIQEACVGSSSYQNQVFVLVFGVIHHSFRVLAWCVAVVDMQYIFYFTRSFLSYNLEICANSLKIDCVLLFISLSILVLIFFITFCFALMPFEVFFFCFVPRHFISFIFFYPI